MAENLSNFENNTLYYNRDIRHKACKQYNKITIYDKF